MEIDFEGRAPTDPDCHGISQLLQRVFLRAPVNTMQMADMIIGKCSVNIIFTLLKILLLFKGKIMLAVLFTNVSKMVLRVIWTMI